MKSNAMKTLRGTKNAVQRGGGARLAVCFLVLILLGWSGTAGAFEVYPFYTRHMSPLVQIFGLPPVEDGTLTPAGHLDGRVVLDIANNFNWGNSPTENLNLDGETYRTTLAFRYGLSKRLEIGLDIPYVAHTGGVFDSFIEDFHSAFGFTNRSRNKVPKNQLDYHYIRNGVTRFDISHSTSGIGDVMLSMGVGLLGERGHSPQNRSLALRMGVKLPTGDSARLLGSGGTDVYLSLAGTDPATLSGLNLTLFGELGELWITHSAVLPDLTRHFVEFGTLGCGWTPLSWLALKVQFDVHSPFYRDTKMDPMGPWATQVDGGFTFALPKKTFFDLGISEPIMVETAPDVDFHFALRRLF